MQTLHAHGACCQLASNRDRSEGPTAAAPNSNFWRCCSWSPDGTCILAAQDDNILQVLAAPQDARKRNAAATSEAGASFSQLVSATTLSQSESLYACDWYPGFRAEDAQTACFAASCRGQPVHLWDSFLGTIRSTYRTYDQVDEVATAHALRFHPDGERYARTEVLAYCTVLLHARCIATYDTQCGLPKRCSRQARSRAHRAGSWPV